MNNLKWFLVCILTGIVVYFYLNNKINKLENNINEKDVELLTKEGFIQSKEISLKQLIKKNDSLSNIVKNYKPEKIIQYRTIYKDSIKYIISEDVDSIYNFKGVKSNLEYELNINAKKLNGYSLKYKLSDNFVIIEKDNEIFIKSDNGIIETPTIYKDTKKVSKFKFNTNVSVGYGLIHKKFDVYLGVGVGYNF